MICGVDYGAPRVPGLTRDLWQRLVEAPDHVRGADRTEVRAGHE